LPDEFDVLLRQFLSLDREFLDLLDHVKYLREVCACPGFGKTVIESGIGSPARVLLI